MSPFDLSILLYEATATIDSIFESWMAVTFAFIVASYVAGNRLSISFKVFVSTLYLACATLLFFRYINFAGQAFHYLAELEKHDISMMKDTSARALGFIRSVVFIGGTFGAIFFLFLSMKHSDE